MKKNIYEALIDRITSREMAVLATILETRGSVPQVPGVSAVFSSTGLIDGTLGGGVMEASAEEEAVASADRDVNRTRLFSLTDDIATDGGAVCGGEALILFDKQPALSAATFQMMCDDLAAGVAGVQAVLISGKKDGAVTIKRSWLRENQPVSQWQHVFLRKYRGEVSECLLHAKTRLIRVEGGAESNMLYLESNKLPPHLVIAGAGHIGRSLARLAHRLDFRTTVIDDRDRFANRERFPDTESIRVGDISGEVARIRSTADTYFVIVTRGHQNDSQALRACIKSKAAYVGLIGSRRKIKQVRNLFIDNGWASNEQFDRVSAPIGLEIGSQTVEEIAVSIAAQLVQVRSLRRDNG